MAGVRSAMHIGDASRIRSIAALMVLLVCGLGVFPAQGQTPSTTFAAPRAPVTAEQISEYRRSLAEYTIRRQPFDAAAEAYWSSVVEKRKLRNAKRRANQTVVVDDYVLTQPPVYSGPPRPIDPSAPDKPAEPRPYIPVIADVLRHAVEQFKFTPRAPASELDFKKAYANVAARQGLTRDQVVRIYGFESGGNGRYTIQAGLESDRPGARALSTAIGYNQLLTTNTIGLLSEHGGIIVKALKDAAAASVPERRRELLYKAALVERMIAVCKTVPHQWSEHEKLGLTPPGIAVHALNLDVDVGPWLQSLKLIDSINFARRRGVTAPLTAAELEMMNLTGDGNGFDIVSMPVAMRGQVPTSNFFQRGGYERNPIAIRNNVVSKLIAATNAKMDKEMNLQGAKDLAAAF